MADETTLAQIFAKQPPFTDAELTAVIEEYRANRARYLTGAKAPAKAKKAKGETVDLGDVEL